jgi:hypothetical protein
LESYHPYLPPQKVSKNLKIDCIHSILSKNTKSHFGCLGLLGVNILLQVYNFKNHDDFSFLYEIINNQRMRVNVRINLLKKLEVIISKLKLVIELHIEV